MIIDINSIKINGTAVADKLTEAIYSFNKLWGDDTGRTLNGNFSGTFRGIFPKIELTFKPLTQTELEALVPLFDTAYQTFTYYDPYKQATVSMQTYAGDYSYTIDNVNKTKTIKISFISTKKRS